MPKVSEAYMLEKKKFIIGKLREIAKSKPIFAITMQELITCTGMSQGAIYRYFKDIDQVIGALYWELSNQQKDVEAEFRQIFEDCAKDEIPEQIIYDAIIVMADFYTRQGSVFNEVNKMIWELNILYLYNKQRVKKIVGNTEQNNITVIVKDYLLQYLQSQINNGYFHPVMDIGKGAALIYDCYDGIVRNYYMLNYYQKDKYNRVQSEMKDLYSMLDGLAVFVLHIIGGDENKIQHKVRACDTNSIEDEKY